MGDQDMYFTDPAVAAQHDTIELQEGVYDLPKNSGASTVRITDVNAPATNPRPSTVRITDVNVPAKKKKKCDTKTSLIILAIICIIIAGGVGALLYFSVDDNSKYNDKSSFISVWVFN